MSTSSQDSVFCLGVTQVIVPVGNTLAVLIDGSQTPGVNTVIMKYFSGGTLSILGVGSSGTLTAAQLAGAGASGGYVLGASEVLNFDGPTRFYLASTGATSVAHLILGKTQSS